VTNRPTVCRNVRESTDMRTPLGTIPNNQLLRLRAPRSRRASARPRRGSSRVPNERRRAIPN